MEDVQEPVLDIDACDRKDPLAVVEYVDDIYILYKKIEVTFDFCSPKHPGLWPCCIINTEYNANI